jgi:hypothetical protein
MITDGIGGMLGVFTLARHPELFAAWVNLGTPMSTTYLDPDNFVFGLHEISGNALPISMELKRKAYARTLDPLGRMKDVKLPSFHYIYSNSSVDESDKAAKILRKAGLPVVTLIPPTRYSIPEYAGLRKQGIEDQERLYGEALKFLETYLPKSAQPAPNPGSSK